MRQILRIGLTGGIGSGKTTVSNMFKALGIPVIDADVIARDIVEPGLPAYNRLVDLFGKRIIDDNNHLKRELIRELVFKDEGLRRRLEKIIHPEVLKVMERRIEACEAPYCILSIPLLLESDEGFPVDRILVVDVDEDLQLERSMKRDNLSREQATAVINSQVDRQSRLKAADDIIDNTDDLETTKRQVDDLHNKYLEMTSHTKTAEKFVGG